MRRRQKIGGSRYSIFAGVQQLTVKMEMSSTPTLASSGRESSVLDFISGSAVALGDV